ncbi:MAG TPA: VIT1/CCC1 transporter family protein [Pseudomonadales bacterium]
MVGKIDRAAAASWYEEKQSAWLYRVLATVEPRPTLSKLFDALANEADAQAKLWEKKVSENGGAMPAFSPAPRARVVAALVRRFGAKPMRQVLSAMKVRGMSAYSSAHPGGHEMPVTLEEVGKSHRGVGGNLRAAVFGANDGLISNASLIMGIAGATSDTRMILLTGVAGLLAGALSMAAGEFISVRSQRELYEHQILLERDELDEYPAEEAEELALIYAARGMDLDEARRVSQKMLADPTHALDVLAREELGLNPDNLGSAWGAAAFSFACFGVGALVPLLPFLLGVGGIVASGVVTGVSLFGLGATISLFTGRRALLSGIRMLAIGAAAAGLTFALGYMLGVGIG